MKARHGSSSTAVAASSASGGGRRSAPAGCAAVPSRSTEGTWVEVEASSGGGLISKAMGKADRGPTTRALQVIRLLSAGAGDARTVYRDRRIPPGPVTLVASWAGMPYRLFTEPRHDAPRGREIFTATEVEAARGAPGGLREGPRGRRATRAGSKPTRSFRRRPSRPAKRRSRRRVSPDEAGEWLKPRLCRG